MSGPAAATADVRAGLIGPNAIVRVAEALQAPEHRGQREAVFARAGLAGYLAEPPAAMVPEHEVRTLHHALRAELGPAQAADVAAEAGRRTADYLLAHRIPRPVQLLLKRLPAAWAARVLIGAIRRHAWTFAGSGRFSAVAGHPVRLEIRHNPMCADLKSDAPACAFYAATFERLFAVLVHRRSRVSETSCEAMCASACRFELRWDDAGTPQLAPGVRPRW
jgi:divinyl protochlorophyllide a 8-vinyl-reductase